MAKTCDQSNWQGPPNGTWLQQVESGEKRQGARQADGDGGDRGGLGDRKPRPHIKKGGRIAIGAAQVDIFAAGVGQHGAELGIGHGAEEREQPADDPCKINERGGAGVAHHFAGHKKNAAADDGADDDGRGLAAPSTRGRSAGLAVGIADRCWLMR